MPRYYFDIQDEQGTVTDEVGVEIDNLDIAMVEARRALLDMARESLPTRTEGKLRIVIRNGEDGWVGVVVSLATEREQDQ